MPVLRVVEPFAADVDGVPRVFPAGHLIQSNDPVAKGRERFFVKVEDFVSRQTASGAVETATAAPGERRQRSEAAKKAIVKAARRMSGADDGEKDPESGSNQVKGVNKKDGDPVAPGEQNLTKAQEKVIEENAAPTGADDGEPDPESGASQVPGVNDDLSAKPGDGYDDGMSGTADDGGPTTGITTDDVEPKPAKKSTAKKAAAKTTDKG